MERERRRRDIAPARDSPPAITPYRIAASSSPRRMWAHPRLPRYKLTYGGVESERSSARSRSGSPRPLDPELQERPHRPVQPSQGAASAKLGEDLPRLLAITWAARRSSFIAVGNDRLYIASAI